MRKQGRDQLFPSVFSEDKKTRTAISDHHFMKIDTKRKSDILSRKNQGRALFPAGIEGKFPILDFDQEEFLLCFAGTCKGCRARDPGEVLK